MKATTNRLAAAGIILPEVSPPIASYLPVMINGSVAYVSGQLPRCDGQIVMGVVGETIAVEEARAAARLCGVAILANLAHALDGDLDRVERCTQLFGFVNAPSGFTDHPTVIDGASDLMIVVFGDAGRHARAAVGCSSLPLGAAVEVAANFFIRA